MRHYVYSIFDDLFDNLWDLQSPDPKPEKIEVELPGVKKENINVRFIETEGKHNIQITGKSRNGSTFSRAYRVSPDLNKDSVKAEFINGLLTINLSYNKGTEKDILIT